MITFWQRNTWDTFKFLSVNCNWFSCALILFILSHCNFPLSWVFDICLIFNVFFFHDWLDLVSYHLSSSEIYFCSIWISDWKMEAGQRWKLAVMVSEQIWDWSSFYYFFEIIHVFFPRTDEPSPTWLQAACIIYFLHRAGDVAYVLYAHVWETFE